MKTRKATLLILGSCLVLASLCLVLFLGIRTHLGAKTCQQVLTQLSTLLPQRTPGVPGTQPNTVMPILEIDGTDYVAILEIPAYGVTLPVADRWDRHKLSASPARFWGSAYDRTLVIGGADAPRQLGFCDQIEEGALVTVTDMTGVQFDYAVSGVDRAKHAETQWLTDAACDLTLFCHDLYSMEYIAVRCISAHR